MKTFAIEILKMGGCLLLLAILVKGIAGVLLYVDSIENWIGENEDGDFVNMRLSVAWFGGPLLWFWLLAKIKRAGMNDDDKKDSDRFARSGEDDEK